MLPCISRNDFNRSPQIRNELVAFSCQCVGGESSSESERRRFVPIKKKWVTLFSENATCPEAAMHYGLSIMGKRGRRKFRTSPCFCSWKYLTWCNYVLNFSQFLIFRFSTYVLSYSRHCSVRGNLHDHLMSHENKLILKLTQTEENISSCFQNAVVEDYVYSQDYIITHKLWIFSSTTPPTF